jgi:transcription termination factor Rho
MSETTDTAPETGGPGNTPEKTPAKKGGAKGLGGMLLPELRQLAGGLGIKTSGMRKGDLVEAIKAAQGGGNSGGRDQRRSEQGSSRQDERTEEQPSSAKRTESRPDAERQPSREENRGQGQRGQAGQSNNTQQGPNSQKDGQKDRDQAAQKDQKDQKDAGQNAQSGNQANNAQNSAQNSAQNRADDEAGGSRRNRRRRGRDRGGNQAPQGSANQGGNQGGNQGTPSGTGRTRGEPDLQILEDDVLAPCAGILDLLDNYAFVRTSGYLPGPEDVYVSMSMVRRYGLRRGDAVTGQVRQPREGERKEKYNPLVKIDTVNGAEPEISGTRVEFSKLTPLYPSERLRMETTPANVIGRVIDIASPIGKGQRGLIVSPAKAGKTMILQSIANSITANNPECHLMVVLVDERPEEVTDFERSVNGEVISSTFDRPPADHTIVAELAIERAKRLVELGHDVVVLLDGITRLGRAYNLAAPASGRILSGGVDSAALYPPKKFFGAARNIEDGGSLTILATALIESGSKMDEVIFEEFKGTGNLEIRLRRDFADKRLFPAIDVVASGTRREELLMSSEELSIIWKLRRVLSGLEGQQALELLLQRLKKSQNNIEFLRQVQQTTPTLQALQE